MYQKPFLLRTFFLATYRDNFATYRNWLMPFLLSSEIQSMTKEFHKALKLYFKGKNLSEVSRQLEIPRSLLQDWIQEGREPSFKNLIYLKRISDYLGLSLDELLLGKPTSKIINSVTFEDDGKQYQILISRLK